MSVPIEFICAIVKRTTLDKVYEGGSEAYIETFGPFDNRVNCADDHLIKEGAMNPADIEGICRYWDSLGLTGVAVVDGQKQWVDYCVVDELMGLTLPCSWLDYDRERQLAFLK